MAGKSAVRSILSAEHVGAALAAFFAVPRALELTLEQAAMNDTYAVHAGKKAYFFKIYRCDRRSAAEVSGEADALAAIAAAGVAVAKPVAGRDGTFVCPVASPEGRRYGMLCERLVGAAVAAPKSADYRALGRLAATLHTVAGLEKASAARPALDCAHLVTRPLQAMLGTSWIDKDYARKAAQAARQLEQTWTRLQAARLPTGFCHGDLHTGNVVKGARGKLAVFDFDLSGPGFLAYDLAVFKWTRAMAAPPEQAEADWQEYRLGYEAVRRLTAGEAGAMDALVLARYFWGLGYLFESAHISGAGWLRQSLPGIGAKLDHFRKLAGHN